MNRPPQFQKKPQLLRMLIQVDDAFDDRLRSQESTMLFSKGKKTAAHYRLQAAHIREFLETVHDDDQLRTVLLDAAGRLDELAAEQDLATARAERSKKLRQTGAEVVNLGQQSSVSEMMQSIRGEVVREPPSVIGPTG